MPVDRLLCTSTPAASFAASAMSLFFMPRASGMVIRRLRSRRRAGGVHVQPDRHRLDEQHRSAGLARRRAVPHCRSPGSQARRTPALELEAPICQASPATPSYSGCQSALDPALTAALGLRASLTASLLLPSRASVLSGSSKSLPS